MNWLQNWTAGDMRSFHGISRTCRASSHNVSISVSHPQNGGNSPYPGDPATLYVSALNRWGEKFSICSRAIFSNLCILDQEIAGWFFSKIPQWSPVFRYPSQESLCSGRHQQVGSEDWNPVPVTAGLDPSAPQMFACGLEAETNSQPQPKPKPLLQGTRALRRLRKSFFKKFSFIIIIMIIKVQLIYNVAQQSDPIMYMFL